MVIKTKMIMLFEGMNKNLKCLNILKVAHGIYYMIREKIPNKLLEKTELFSLLFSALCHDVDHTGKTNIFEINS